MIEKVLGSAKMLLISITALIINILAFQVYCFNTHQACCGASAVFYAYGPIAFYIIAKVFLYNKKSVWSQPLWYIYLFEFSAMWILIPLISPYTTNLFHSIGFIVGIVFLYIWRKVIKNEVDYLILDKERKTQPPNKWYNILWLLPLAMILIILLYWMGYIIV
jgi:membrane associated rhomboid family serine protease